MGNQDDYLAQKKIINNYFPAFAKEFIWTKRLYHYNKGRIKIDKEELNTFMKECSNRAYRDIIVRQITQNNKRVRDVKKQVSDRLFLINSKKSITIDQLISKYVDNLLVLDFWASWCIPCRSELPFSNFLSKEMAGKKIKFLYISMDRTPAIWAKASYSEQLDPKNSFLLADKDASEFIKKYKIITIPRYLLLGKDGLIINDNLPSPSDSAFKKIIDKMLR